jgi:2-oxoglutarate ferredoxin oxidoreductase subunit gamma
MKSPVAIQRFELRLSGLGGQGILTLGKVLGAGLAVEEGYYVAQTQSYGPEARGGASRSDLVISSEPISYPKPEQLDLLVALSQEACNLYYRHLKQGGLLLVDDSLVKQTPTNMYWGLPFTTLAKDKLGMAQAANMVLLGALAYLVPFVAPRAMKKSLENNLSPRFLASNVKAFQLGHTQAKKKYPDVAAQWTSS